MPHQPTPSQHPDPATEALAIQIAHLRRALEEAHALAADRERDLRLLAERLRAAEEGDRAARQRVFEILNSRSWRITRPVRAVSRLISVLRGRG